MEKSVELKALVAALKARTNQPVVDDYYFLIRVGSNWPDYPFEWEPFRDLAGPMSAQAGGIPVAVLSVPSATEPATVVSEGPVPHVEITVAPNVPVKKIVEAWIAELLNQSVKPRVPPAPLFLEYLGLRPSDVSGEVRSFLSINE